MRKKRKILLERERIVLSKTWHVEWTIERDDCHITFYFENLSQRNLKNSCNKRKTLMRCKKISFLSHCIFFLLIESTYFKNLKEKSCQADRALLTKTDLKNNSYCDSYPIRGRWSVTGALLPHVVELPAAPLQCSCLYCRSFLLSVQSFERSNVVELSAESVLLWGKGTLWSFKLK